MATALYNGPAQKWFVPFSAKHKRGIFHRLTENWDKLRFIFKAVDKGNLNIQVDNTFFVCRRRFYSNLNKAKPRLVVKITQ